MNFYPNLKRTDRERELARQGWIKKGDLAYKIAPMLGMKQSTLASKIPQFTRPVVEEQTESYREEHITDLGGGRIYYSPDLVAKIRERVAASKETK